MYDILPKSEAAQRASAAEKTLDSRLTGTMTVLLGHKDFEIAKQAVESLVQGVRSSFPKIKIDGRLPSDGLDQMGQFIFQTRYHILDSQTKEALRNNRLKELKENALAALSGPVSLGASNQLDLDPFLLTQARWTSYLTGAASGFQSMELRDGYLTSQMKDTTYILVRFKQNDSGFSLKSEGQAAPVVLSQGENLKKDIPGLEVHFSGVPFHSWESSQRSQSEISLLGTVSMILIILVLWILYRSVWPMLTTSISLGIGVGVGLAATFLAFGEMHIFTLVFGTSLIGISMDYGFHFFSEWGALEKGETLGAMMRRIFPGIFVGLLTTLISYVGFLLTGFPFLQQMALFSFAGLVSTWLTVVFLFPYVPNPKPKSERSVQWAVNLIQRLFLWFKAWSMKRKIFLGVLLGLGAFAGLWGSGVSNDVKSFYTMSARLKTGEQKTYEFLSSVASGTYLLIPGKDLQDALEREEALQPQLESLQAQGRLKSWVSLSSFIPSAKTQKENLSLVSEKLKPAVPGQLMELGFEKDSVLAWEEDFQSSARNIFSSNEFKTNPLGSITEILDLGMTPQGYYLTILLNGAQVDEAFRRQVTGSEGMVLIQKVPDINRTLQDLSYLALWVLSAAYLVIFLLVLPRYGWLRSLKIVLIPVAASLFTLALIKLFGAPINLFVILGLIMVPGMGTDYVIFIIEGESRIGPPGLAITMGMLTTILSFGLLGFTAFAGIFGISVALGVFLSFVLTLIYGQGKFPSPGAGG